MPDGTSQVFLPNGAQAHLPTNPGGPGWSDGPPAGKVFALDLESVVGGTVMWHRQRPLFQALQTVTQSVPNLTWTSMGLDTVLLDNYGGQGTVSSQFYSILTSNTTDYYLCTGYVPWNTTVSANVFIAGLTKNGTIYSEGTKIPAGTGHNNDCFVADIVALSSGNDYVELAGFQSTSVAVSTLVSGKTPSFTVRWVGGAQHTSVVAAPTTPHTWIPQDEISADATGASSQSPGVKVPLNREARDAANWLNGPPIARLTSVGSGQSITNGGTFQSVQFPTATIDNYTGWASGTNTRYTAQRPGLYLVIGYGSVTESSGTHTGYRAVRLSQTFAAGGSTTFAGTSTVPNSGSTDTTGTALYATAMIRLAVGDYVELQMAQTQTNAPTALAVNNSAGNSSKLNVIWMSL